MTSVQVNGDEIMAVIHVIRIVGSIVTMLVIGAVILWAVRSPRRAGRDAVDTDSADNEAIWRLVERMEERLKVLERALADQVEPRRARKPRQDEIFASADAGRASGRTE